MNNYEIRLYEIKYYDLINKFFRYTKDNTKLYDFLELISVMFGCDLLLMKQVTMSIILDEHCNRPTNNERVILLTKTGHSVRGACKLLKMSTSTYYNTLNKYNAGDLNISKRFTDKQSAEIVKAIDGLIRLITIIT